MITLIDDLVELIDDLIDYLKEKRKKKITLGMRHISIVQPFNNPINIKAFDEIIFNNMSYFNKFESAEHLEFGYTLHNTWLKDRDDDFEIVLRFRLDDKLNNKSFMKEYDATKIDDTTIVNDILDSYKENGLKLL